MSVAQSIFEKICPACATILSVAAERCECGHTFTLSQGGHSDNSAEAALRDEELYENYLAARAAQAQEAARGALTELAANPGDTRKAADSELAQEVAKSLQADLNEQRAKIRALQAALPKPAASLPSLPVAAPEKPRPRPIALEQEIQPAPASMTTISALKAVEAPVAKPHAEPDSRRETSPVPESAAMRTPSPKPASAPASPLISAARAASVLESIKQAKARERADRYTETPPQDTPPITSDTASVPPPAFRAEQSARAQQAIANLKALDEKCCPNCTSNVPKNTTRCRCGYAFVADGNDLPSLTLCTGDFTALRDSLNLNLRRG